MPLPIIRRIRAQPLLMTEKDAVKCRAFTQDNWWYLPVSATLPAEAGERLLAVRGAAGAPSLRSFRR